MLHRRNVEIEQFGEFCRCLSGVGVAPCAERGEDFSLVVERHVSVHHGTYSYGGEVFYLHIILFAYVAAQVGVTVLHAVPYRLQTVCPQTVDELVFPFVAALRYRCVALVNEHRFDSRATEFDAEDGLALLYCLFRVVHLSACV